MEFFIFSLILFTQNMLNTVYRLIQNVEKYILIFWQQTLALT